MTGTANSDLFSLANFSPGSTLICNGLLKKAFKGNRSQQRSLCVSQRLFLLNQVAEKIIV